MKHRLLKKALAEKSTRAFLISMFNLPIIKKDNLDICPLLHFR